MHCGPSRRTARSPIASAHVRGDAADFPEALVGPLSVILGTDEPKSVPETVRKGSATALVAAASGIGDLVRVTPLIRVLAQLGYSVDFLIAPDYPDCTELSAACATSTASLRILL
jgi:hypothetical protein